MNQGTSAGNYRDDSLLVAERIAELESELGVEVSRAVGEVSPWRPRVWNALAPLSLLVAMGWVAGTDPATNMWAKLGSWSGSQPTWLALTIALLLAAATLGVFVFPMWLGSRLRCASIRRRARVSAIHTGRDRMARLERALGVLREPRVPGKE